MFSKIFKVPLSWLYGFGVDFRNWLYDSKIIKSTEFDIPVVCVGNITVGGTGKTPHVEYLIEFLSKKYNVAVISRGYKRKTKGYILVDIDHTSRQVGDEPKQIKHKFPNIPVAVCADRVQGIEYLREDHPEINLIIMDDGMQHRRVKPKVNVALIDINRPIYEDYLLPNGSLRDRRSKLSIAQIVIVTKCPEHIQPIEMRLIYKNLNLMGYQNLYFSRMGMLKPQPIFPHVVKNNTDVLMEGDNVVLMSGIGNPKHFKDSISSKYKIIDTIVFTDHHVYKTKDLKLMQQALKKDMKNVFIVTTEKDATKLFNSKKIPRYIMERLYYIPIRCEFINFLNSNSNLNINDEEYFKRNVIKNVQKNH
ncbi:MAG: tetraacyldisaccharide 4'-kinase [Rikenellaceae bacterium]